MGADVGVPPPTPTMWGPPTATLVITHHHSSLIIINRQHFSRAEWNQYEATQTKRKTIEIRDGANDSREKVEIKDRITKMTLGYDHLLVTTPQQLYVFR